MRRDLRVIEAERELDLDMRLLVGRRRDRDCQDFRVKAVFITPR
jgi:hypothetical protein